MVAVDKEYESGRRKEHKKKISEEQAKHEKLAKRYRMELWHITGNSMVRRKAMKWQACSQRAASGRAQMCRMVAETGIR